MSKKDRLAFTIFERNHGLEFQSYNHFFSQPFNIWLTTDTLRFESAGLLDSNASVSKGYKGHYRFMLPIPEPFDGIVTPGNYRFDEEESNDDQLIHYFGE